MGPRRKFYVRRCRELSVSAANRISVWSQGHLSCGNLPFILFFISQGHLLPVPLCQERAVDAAINELAVADRISSHKIKSKNFEGGPAHEYMHRNAAKAGSFVEQLLEVRVVSAENHRAKLTLCLLYQCAHRTPVSKTDRTSLPRSNASQGRRSAS